MDKAGMHTVAFYDELYPFTWTRRVGQIRLGILTLDEKWARLVEGGRPAWVPENVVPDRALAAEIAMSGGDRGQGDGDEKAREKVRSGARRLRFPWEIFQFNEKALTDDFALLTEGRVSQPLPGHVQAIGQERIFVEEGAVLEHAILNASAGPIYIAAGVTVMDGACIRGPFAACEGTVVKMGAKIYGATTLGPYCTVGGEVKNVVMFGYSNKAHDGYLGDAVIGEWCNLGAGCTNSNVKNNAGQVKVWHQASGVSLPAGVKCGLLMGDYSRAAINTSFNTGTVVGVSCNVFTEGLTSTHIPSFSWGAGTGECYRLEDALRHIGNWKKFKNQGLTNDEIQALTYIFEKI